MTLQDLGQTIRTRREASGLSIDDVAARIKVSARTLRAIEDGSTDGLPHAVYTKGFIRSFALTVGYDPEELNKDIEHVFPAEAFDDAKPEPGPINRSMPPPPGVGRKVFVMLFFLIILAGVAAGGWYVATTYGDDILHMVKQPFSAVTTPASPRAQAAAMKPEEGVKSATSTVSQNRSGSFNGADVNVSATLQASAAKLPSPPAVNATPKPEAAPAAPALPAAPASAGVSVSGAGTPAAPAAAQAEKAPVAAADGTNQIYIKAQQTCWVSSRADGGRGRHLTMQPNENFVLTYSKNLELTLGNAGGVTITHNGVDMGPAGKPGQRVVLTFPR